MGKFVSFLILILLTVNSYALIPLESLMLGDLSKQYALEKDPINYIFEEKVQGKDKKLSNYLAFANEGYNLDNYCKSNIKINYVDNWSRTQVKRSILSTLQYIGLDLTTRAIAEYAKFFEFNANEFENLTQDLIGNYCSQNVSVISLKQLKGNFKRYYNVDKSFSLPNVEGDEKFPKALWQTTQETISKGQEMSVTIDLFKAFCSWGNDVDNLRLMVPLVKDPAIMSFVHRQLVGQEFDLSKDEVGIKKSNDTVSVVCENLICRKKQASDIYKQLKPSLGGQNYKDDFDRMFCTDFKQADFQYQGQVPEILKIIRSMTFDDQNAQAGQFVALITGVPDFMNRVEKYNVMKSALKASFDKSWRDWASTQIENYQQDLLYEERLVLKVVDRRKFFNEYTPDFAVNIDVTLGEFDNSIAMNDKIKSTFEIEVSKKFISWARMNWKEVNVNDQEEVKTVLAPFEIIIRDQIKDARASFEIPPWKEGLERVVAIEVLEQVSRYIGSYFNEPAGMMKIPVNLHYGVFALRYTHEKWKIAQDAGERTERIKKLQELLPGR